MQLVIIPAWIDQALSSASLELSAVSDIEKLKSILSLEDVAFYIWIQNNYSLFVPGGIAESFYTPPAISLTTAINSNVEYGKQLEAEYNRFSAQMSVSSESTLLCNLVGRHVAGVSDKGLLGVQLSDLTYEVIPVDENTIGIRVYIAEEGCGATKSPESFYYSLCDTYQIYKGFSELVRKRFFTEFLTLLGR